MPSFLFWNVAGRPVQELIISLTLGNKADVLVLAECKLNPNELVSSLNRRVPEYQYAPGLCESLLFFTKFDSGYLSLMAEPRVFQSAG